MLKTFMGSLLSVIFPKTCLACHRSLKDNDISDFICPDCWSSLKKNVPPLCTICGRQIRKVQIYKSVCPDCQRQHFSFDRAFSPCVYEGITRELIHKFKYQNRDYLSRTLGRIIIDFIRQEHITLSFCDLVIPVPLHNAKLREREFNQAELLARQIAREFSLPVSTSNLWRKKYRKPQVELKEEKRKENIQGCFGLRNPAEVRGKNIILVDDVLTTGATCSEAASVLKAAGAFSVWVLTLAN